MPTVPRRNPNAYVPPGRTPTLQPGNAFQPPAPIPIGAAVQQIGKIIEQKIQRAEEVVLLEADNRLADAATNLRTSALSTRGKDALAVGVQVQEDWEKTVSEVESSLTSDRQRAAFRERSSSRWQQLNAVVQSHGAQEFQKYDAEQSELAINKRVDEAVTNYGDPRALRQAVSEAKYLVELYGSRNGFSPEQIADKQLAATTRIHTQVIARMVADSKDILASDYFKKMKSEIATDSVTKLTEQLEVASTEGEALRGAGDIWKRLGPKSLNDPVTLSTMEQEAREKYAANPKVVKAVIQDLRMRREAHNSEQVEVGASNKAAVLGAFAKGAGVHQLVRSSEYLALSGTEQEQVKSYMVRSRKADENEPPSKRNWAAYWGYSSPSKLAAMSENQVLSLAPEIGQGLVNQLMQQKRTVLKSEEQVREATIDADLFGTIANDAGLNPYDKDSDKAVLARLRSTVETEIERHQQARGRRLTRDEKQSVMQQIIDRKVMVDRWGVDEAEREATLSKDDRGRSYYPIAAIADSDIMAAVHRLRALKTALPGDNAHEVIRKFRPRIERAYAAELRGASPEEIDNILAGK